MNDRRSGTLIETAPYAVVENVRPQVDGGRFAVKRVIGESVVVTADAFSHGHERVACVLRYRPWQGDWSEVEMEALGNDRWKASFLVNAMGRWEYAVACWPDHVESWRESFARRLDREDMMLAARTGAELVAACAGNATGTEREMLARLAATLADERDVARLRAAAADETTFAIARRHAPRADDRLR